MGEEKLKARLQESLHTATRTGAAKPADFTRVIVDTTVQPKAIAFPTDAKLLHRARELLVRLAHRHGVRLRQSYTRLGKIALIRHQRYAHAKQFKRANRMLRTLRTQLGRVIRDIMRKIAGQCRTARDLRPAALTRQPGAITKAAPARSEDRQPARTGSGVYRQGQGASAIRIWRQGLGGDHAEPVQRRAVRRSCRGTARQSV